MNADDRSTPRSGGTNPSNKLRRKSSGKRPKRVRDVLARFQALLEKAGRDSGFVVRVEAEVETPKGCDESLVSGKGKPGQLLVSKQDALPSSMGVAEVLNAEGERIANRPRPSSTKRSSRLTKRSLAH